jgi:high-affinity Fe2+/Pb2+ permease
MKENAKILLAIAGAAAAVVIGWLFCVLFMSLPDGLSR